MATLKEWTPSYSFGGSEMVTRIERENFEACFPGPVPMAMGELDDSSLASRPASEIASYGGSSGSVSVPYTNLPEPMDYAGGPLLVNWGSYKDQLQAEKVAGQQFGRPQQLQSGMGVPNRVAQLEAENARLKQRLADLEATHALYRDLVTRRMPRLSAGWELQPCITTGARRPEGSDPIPARALRGGWA